MTSVDPDLVERIAHRDDDSTAKEPVRFLERHRPEGSLVPYAFRNPEESSGCRQTARATRRGTLPATR